MTSTHIDVTAIDFGALGAWMDARGLPTGPFERVAPVTGGTQNMMVRFERGGAAYVLRRPPLHPRARSNEVSAGRRGCSRSCATRRWRRRASSRPAPTRASWARSST